MSLQAEIHLTQLNYCVDRLFNRDIDFSYNFLFVVCLFVYKPDFDFVCSIYIAFVVSNFLDMTNVVFVMSD